MSKGLEPTDHFHDSDQPITAGRIRFESAEKYPEIARNKDLNKLAHHAQRVRAAVKSIKNDEVATRGSQVVRVDDLFTKQNRAFDNISNEAMQNIEATINQATSQLFTNSQSLSTAQYPLQTAILEKYLEADVSGRSELIDNENSARVLTALAKNGLLPDKTLDYINKRHSPGEVATLDAAQDDIKTLKKMQKEYGLFQMLNRNPAEAERLRSTQFDGLVV